MEQGKKFYFSIVMSVYNVEAYIDEAVQSVLHQDIGFEDHVQIIFVDDGSTDRSGEICEQYRQQYPDNIKVFHKENGGVSSAKNVGIKYVDGEVTNFFDPDDILSLDTLSLVYGFYEEHKGEVDIISIPQYFFEGRKGGHALNNKFTDGTRVIDLEKEWRIILASNASAFFSRKAVSQMEFCEKLFMSEDLRENLRILVNNPKMGVVSEAKYYYRKRKTNNNQSLTQSSENKREYYLPKYYENFDNWIIDYCYNKVGNIPKFVQSALLWNTCSKINRSFLPTGLLSDEELKEYQNHLFKFMEIFDDDVILSQNRIPEDRKIMMMRCKKDQNHDLKYIRDFSGNLYECISNIIISNISNTPLKIQTIEFNSNELTLEGQYFSHFLSENTLPLLASVNEKEIVPEDGPLSTNLYCSDVPYAVWKGFRIRIPLDRNQVFVLKFYFSYENKKYYINRFNYCDFSPFSNQIEHSYYYESGWLLLGKENSISIENVSKFSAVKAELKYDISLFKTQKSGCRKAIFIRWLIFFLRKVLRKKLWFVTDKQDRADDNGEALFEYLMKNKRSIGIQPVFLIRKDSPDYQRIRSIGPVLQYSERTLKIANLIGQTVISAYTFDEITNPFPEFQYCYRDLLQKVKRVFLQHGITQNDISDTINRYRKKYDIVVSATPKEYQAFLDPKYGYSEKEIQLTGFPRYDKLEDHDRKIISIMPTYPSYLFESYDPQTNILGILPGFEESDYYRLWNGLLSDQRLLDVAEQFGYKVQFVPHTVLFQYIDRFKVSPQDKIKGYDTRYRDVFSESSLLITDYSSVAFDFAYLRKPVMYLQMTKCNYRRGAFDYDRDGFGEVIRNYDDAVEMIIDYIKKDCKLKEIYRNRINNFFAYNDKNNCKRVYTAIESIDNKTTS